MKLEEALKTTRFESEIQKAMVHLMYTSYTYKTKMVVALKAFGLTAEQYNLLRILKGKYPDSISVKDIASRMIETSANIPRTADRLFLKKLIGRKQADNDKRLTLLSLTDKGLETLENAKNLYRN